ncbi:MAG: UV DNA damage repair endonuclease UvsE [Hyphomonadaceae bacterium]|nr:UV DNA damage repair endonuclease UvsE [Clostridia bacterium]
MSIGYACMVIGEANTTISRCLLKSANDDTLRAMTHANLLALEAMLDYNVRNSILLFRISSDIIPFGSHPANTLYWQNEFNDVFNRLASKIKNAGMRVSMHPGQYTVLNSPTPQIVQNAVIDLKYHALFLDSLQTDACSKIILHVGGVYQDKRTAMDTFMTHYEALPDNVKRRLVIENDDKNYSVEDVLDISKHTQIPVVFDNLHHAIKPPIQNRTVDEWLDLCRQTWRVADGKQKIHYSQQKIGGMQSAHSNTIQVRAFMDFYNDLLDKSIDIMLEVKDKNLSAIKCIHATQKKLPIRLLEQEWARYKYLVLSKSQASYGEIRNMLKHKAHVDVVRFYEIIEQALQLPENKGAQINAAQHIWGYLNKHCTLAEKTRFIKLGRAYSEGTTTIQALKNHLFKCVNKQQVDYLIKSYYFII